MGAMTTTSVYCLFFDGYETLDAMGPIEFLHRVPDVRMRYISVAGASENGGSLVRSAQGFTLKTEIVESLPPGSILLIPGGIGTRSLVMNDLFLQNLAKLVQQSQTCLTVCTGAALLAATGVLDGKSATTNKRAFEWVRGTRPQVRWRQKARWVSTGKFYTSSGVSAGMDMTLGLTGGAWKRLKRLRPAANICGKMTRRLTHLHILLSSNQRSSLSAYKKTLYTNKADFLKLDSYKEPFLQR